MNIDILLLDTPFGLTCPWWWLWSFLAFVLGILVACFIFGWCRYGRKIGELEEDRDRFHQQFTDMEQKYMSLKYQSDEMTKDNTALRASLNKCESDNIVLKVKLEKLQAAEPKASGEEEKKAEPEEMRLGAETAALPYGAIFREDDLQIIEGVGPKIESLLKAAGFTTWGALAVAQIDTLRKVLEEAGPRYRMHDPKSWLQQARLAVDGKWKELIQYQKSHEEGETETPSKVEKMGMKILGFSNDPEDLKVVEGIGPKIEGLLKEAGIRNWSDLAAAPVDRLREILSDAGDKYRLADPGTWPRQAELAAAGNWSELSEYQDRLKGGKE